MENLIKIAKELQKKIQENCNQTCVIHIGKRLDVLFGSGWSDMDDDAFSKINDIIEDFREEYPDIIEEGAAADIVSPDTQAWLDHIGCVFETKYFDVPDYYKMQYLWNNHKNQMYG